ncbi:hypothetical protein [Mariniflexile sp. AS56]|uniref:hypothetical protein n=1 Tax=Mariniflexile sp. AS56 TaxID=3063957 RepID=UPI0026F0B9D0|nr:hypothetical protein [Mariniflexile sp. AS56]MDO7174203.1 hypothetical protein [Mariniflexile sp. AS56]
MSKEEKIKYLEGVKNKLRYLTDKSKSNELLELIHSELRNEHSCGISSVLYTRNLNNTIRDFKTDSFKESKVSFEKDLTNEINRLKFT